MELTRIGIEPKSTWKGMADNLGIWIQVYSRLFGMNKRVKGIKKISIFKKESLYSIFVVFLNVPFWTKFTMRSVSCFTIKWYYNMHVIHSFGE